MCRFCCIAGRLSGDVDFDADVLVDAIVVVAFSRHARRFVLSWFSARTGVEGLGAGERQVLVVF